MAQSGGGSTKYERAIVDPSTVLFGKAPKEVLSEAMVHAGSIKSFTVLAALVTTACVAIQHRVAVDTFNTARGSDGVLSRNESQSIVIPGANLFFAGKAHPFQAAPANWETFYTGATLALTAATFGSLLWLDMTGCMVRSKGRAVAAFAVPVIANWLWYIGAMFLVFHGVFGVGIYGPFSAVASCMQLAGVFGWSLLHRKTLQLVSFSPVKFGLLFSTLGMTFIALFLFVLTGMFNRAGDGVRILIRLVVVPLLGELLSAGMRLGGRQMLDGIIPGASRGFMLLPVSLIMAFIGRFFTTGMNSLGLTIALSLAVAALEVTMRWTMLQRDSVFDACLNKVWRRCSTACRCCCSKQPRSPRPASEPAGTGAALTDHRTRWEDLSVTNRRAKEQRANYAFIIGDTVSEDIGMLTLIPVAVFFRLPTRIGGQPLPLGDVLLRVGFQWLLELATDIGPFVTYAAGRMWLGWRGDTLYRSVTREQVAAALKLHASARAASDGTQAMAPQTLDKSSAKAASVVTAGSALGIDDSMPLASSAASPAAEPGRVASSSSQADSEGASMLNYGVHTLAAGSSVDLLSAPSADAVEGPAEPAGVCGSRYFGRRCVTKADPAAALAHIQAARAPLLADDADVLWQRLPWTAVRAAMAPGAAAGEWSWLHWFTYRNELLATRVATAWRRRQRGWELGFILLVYVLGTTVIRGYFNTRARCPVPDAAGDWYWDACP